MTETEWDGCSEVVEMLQFVAGSMSQRRRRLFGCACARRVWLHLPFECHRLAVETCERFADLLGTAGELAALNQAVAATYRGFGDIVEDHSAMALRELTQPDSIG